MALCWRWGFRILEDCLLGHRPRRPLNSVFGSSWPNSLVGLVRIHSFYLQVTCLKSRGWCTFSWTSYFFFLPFMIHYSFAFFLSGYFHFIEYCNCSVPRGVRTARPLLAGGPHIILSPRSSLDLGLIRQLGTWNKHCRLQPRYSRLALDILLLCCISSLPA